METSFDSSGPQKIGCCGMSKNNEVLVSQNICLENNIEEEIGHLPGQKWPHVVGRQNSTSHFPVKVHT